MSSTVDNILIALADADRREVAATVAGQNRQDKIPVSAVIERSSTDTERLHVACQHCHLPTLEDCGLIDWDRDRDVVAPGPNLPDAQPLLTAVRSIDPSD